MEMRGRRERWEQRAADYRSKGAEGQLGWEGTKRSRVATKCTPGQVGVIKRREKEGGR
jgi:hypothetical protein